MEHRILVVEDQKDIADLIAMHVRDLGHRVDCVHDGNAGLKAAQSGDYAMVVLDVMLPGRDGLDVVKAMRMERNATPVLMLTARSSEIDRVLGLELGADDYLTKPFDLEELQARLRALLRRSGGGTGVLLVHGELQLDPAGRRVSQGGREVVVSAREYALLHDLLAHKGRIRSKAELEDSLYAWGEERESNTVEVYVHHLRKKLGADLIRTVRGLGYVIGGEG